MRIVVCVTSKGERHSFCDSGSSEVHFWKEHFLFISKIFSESWWFVDEDKSWESILREPVLDEYKFRILRSTKGTFRINIQIS